MKYRLVFLSLLLLPLLLWTQSSSDFTLGVFTGYNLSQHYGTKDQTGDYQVQTGFRHGFTSGVDLHLPVTDRFALMYEFSYVTRGSTEKITIARLDGETLVKPARMDVKYYMDYLEFPFLMHYKVINKKDFYTAAVGGLAMALKVKGDYTLDGKIYFPEGDSYTTFILSDKSKLKDINVFDFSLIYGGEVGFRVKSTPLVLAYRFTIGWDYLALPTYPAGDFPPVNLRNQSYSLTLKVPLQIKI